MGFGRGAASTMRWMLSTPDIARFGAFRCSNRFSAGVRHLIPAEALDASRPAIADNEVS